MDIEYKEIKTVGEFIDAIRIRADVFIREQGFEPGYEPDEDDKSSRHFAALADGKIVATARFRKMPKGEIKIERMAARKEHRGKGIAKGLVKFMVNEIEKAGPGKIWLQSQVRAQLFYEKCGFRAVGKPFDMWGVPHIDMEYGPHGSKAAGSGFATKVGF